MNRISRWLVRDDNVERDSYIWNTAGSILLSVQSVLFLVVITRAGTQAEAGIFTLANANSNLFLMVGKFGMHNFQVSDYRSSYSYRQYRNSRILTCSVMVVLALVYLMIIAPANAYSVEKTLAILLMCLFRVVDAAEDLFSAEFQKRGRLDAAGREMTLRQIAVTLVFCISMAVSRQLLLSIILCTVISAAVLSYGVIVIRQVVQTDRGSSVDMHWEYGLRQTSIMHLLWSCLPLFAGTFLSVYIMNAPRYAIDRLLTDELQAVYGFISMPVFVIGMLNGFILNPVIVKFSNYWNEGQKDKFTKRITIQIAVIAGITLACIAGAAILGIPVLSLLYNTDLSGYRADLLILLAGGGLLAAAETINIMITIIRFQQSTLVSYGITAVLAILFSGSFIDRWGIHGASILYLTLILMLFLMLTCSLRIGMHLRKKGTQS